jgi:hypothetical protein
MYHYFRMRWIATKRHGQWSDACTDLDAGRRMRQHGARHLLLAADSRAPRMPSPNSL